jgi:alkylated DNA repair dioxygenase AlkB
LPTDGHTERMFGYGRVVAVWQGSLFALGEPSVDDAATVDRIWLDEHSWIDVARNWLRGADEVCAGLLGTVDWRQGRRTIFDREVDDPRLSRWFHTTDPPPHPSLATAASALGDRYGCHLEGPGLNYYRDGRDSVAFHRDRELRELDETIVAVLTLGHRRPFLVRPRGGGRSRDLSPASGDLLVMGGRCQRDWEHGVPKVASAGARISASWRWAARPSSRHPPSRHPPSRHH